LLIDDLKPANDLPQKVTPCSGNKASGDLELKDMLLSVNYHLTRTCNYKCGFCFHTAKNGFHLPIEQAKKGLSLLKDNGLKKINFAGGEPFIVDKGHFLGELVEYCKKDL
jgi:molybdenum cofactor biosynthesis enzyme MoaA